MMHRVMGICRCATMERDAYPHRHSFETRERSNCGYGRGCLVQRERNIGRDGTWQRYKVYKDCGLGYCWDGRCEMRASAWRRSKAAWTRTRGRAELRPRTPPNSGASTSSPYVYVYRVYTVYEKCFVMSVFDLLLIYIIILYLRLIVLRVRYSCL